MKSKQQKQKEREARIRLNETRADYSPVLNRKLSDFGSPQPKRGGKVVLESQQQPEPAGDDVISMGSYQTNTDR